MFTKFFYRIFSGNKEKENRERNKTIKKVQSFIVSVN